MEPVLPTTPFGRRTLSLAQVASQMVAKERPPEAAAHKWKIFRALCTARERLGRQRALARGAERPPDLSPRDRPDGERSDRLPLERADRVEGARHALVDHARGTWRSSSTQA